MNRLILLLTDAPKPTRNPPKRRRAVYRPDIKGAQIARAAKCYGMTVEAWVKRFGEVTKIPDNIPESRRPKKVGIKYRKRKPCTCGAD